MATDDDTPAAGSYKIGSLALRSARDGDTHVIALLGELDIAGASTLEDELLRVEASDAAQIVVDLGSLEFIDSTGIRLIVMAADRSSADGRLTLLRGPKQVHRVFEITDLASRLPFAAG
jgi:anti-anti-sigma factor